MVYVVTEGDDLMLTMTISTSDDLALDTASQFELSVFPVTSSTPGGKAIVPLHK